jgi:hypothetical protein
MLFRKPIMWTLDEGRAEIARVQQGSREYGYHVALGGGVLNAGQSTKDLDLYFLPLDNDHNQPNPDHLHLWLVSLWGMSQPINDANYPGSTHYKLKLKFQPVVNKRIDVFII